MKWFKHENTFNNPKIERFTEKFGSEGYGVYFRIVELIATNIEPDNKEEWGSLPIEYDEEYLAKKLGVTMDKLRSIIKECLRLNLLQKPNLVLECKQILERADDYTQRIINKTPNKLRSDSEQSSSRIEENRIDKIKKDVEEKRVEREEKQNLTSPSARSFFEKAKSL